MVSYFACLTCISKGKMECTYVMCELCKISHEHDGYMKEHISNKKNCCDSCKEKKSKNNDQYQKNI